jgi:hypothetical protein
MRAIRAATGTVALIAVGLGVLLVARGHDPVTPRATADTARGPGIPPAPGGSQNAPPNQNPGASTANLKKVAGALHLDRKSVTVVVTLPPGLGVTNRVDVSVDFDERGTSQRITQPYDNTKGNRILANLAEGGGAKRRAEVVISLAEKTSGGSGNAAVYSVRSTVDLEPLYDIAVSPLSFYLVNDCDEFGESEPHIYFRLPTGQVRDAEFSMSGGETFPIGKFAQIYHGVGQSARLGFPTFTFNEDDFFDPVHEFYSTNPDPNQKPVLPGTTQKVAFDMYSATDNFCAAKLSYTVTLTLLRYPDLGR